jgi:hypothetical protein
MVLLAGGVLFGLAVDSLALGLHHEPSTLPRQHPIDRDLHGVLEKDLVDLSTTMMLLRS